MTEEIEKLQQEKVALYADVKKYRGEKEALQKQVEYLQRQCRKAGKAILDQQVEIGGLKKEIDRLDEENSNLRRMISSKDDTE